MDSFKVFVARSFSGSDDAKIKPFEDLLNSFRSFGLTWDTAERMKIGSISKNIQTQIDDCQLFVAVFTRRYPIFEFDQERRPVAAEPSAWIAPLWLYQESGYALKAAKKCMLFREVGVELPHLHGDLEYIDYDPQRPEQAWLKAHQLLSRLLSEYVGVHIMNQITVAEPKYLIEAPLPADERGPEMERPVFERASEKLFTAIHEKDFEMAEMAEHEGAELIRNDRDEIEELQWRCFCRMKRALGGDPIALQRLDELAIEHPTSAEPLFARAAIAQVYKQYKSAADWYVKAASVEPDGYHFRVLAARQYRNAQLYELGREQLRIVLRSAETPEGTTVNALKEMFFNLKDSDDRIGAFAFGEAAIRVVPHDSDFRLELAYAYADTGVGRENHDYNDLALFHYDTLVKQSPDSEIARNNLGGCYSHWEAPIHAVDQFRRASENGYGLATANVIRQYLRAGFLEDARKWADEHLPIALARADVDQALGEVVSAHRKESNKIDEILRREPLHREGLAELGLAAVTCSTRPVQGQYFFPCGTLTLAQNGLFLTGEGEAWWGFPEKRRFRLDADLQNGLWRFRIDSMLPGQLLGTKYSAGLLTFSSDAERALVLEYNSDESVNFYTAQVLGN